MRLETGRAVWGGGGVGRYAVFNNRVNLQLRIMERLGEMTAAARSENLRWPLVADGRENACASTQREIVSSPAHDIMRLYRDIVGRMCCATLGSAGSPSNLQIRENLTGAAIRDPKEDTGKGTEGTAPGKNRRDRTTGAAHDSVTNKAVTLVGDRKGLTAEVEVYEGVMVTTPTPLKIR